MAFTGITSVLSNLFKLKNDEVKEQKKSQSASASLWEFSDDNMSAMDMFVVKNKSANNTNNISQTAKTAVKTASLNDKSDSESYTNSSQVNGLIDERVQQGRTGDCWHISGVMSLNATDAGKENIQNAIKPNPDGSVTITFRGIGRSYTVSAEEIKKHDTDYNTKDAYSNGDNDMLALELAMEKVFDDIRSGKVKGNNSIILSDEGIEGGQTETTKFLLTGKRSQYILPEGDANDLSKEQIYKVFNKAADSQPVAIDFALHGFYGTDRTHSALRANGEHYSINIPKNSGHALFIKKIDKENNTVTFANPWDTEKNYTMSWDEFAKMGVGFISYTQLDKTDKKYDADKVIKNSDGSQTVISYENGRKKAAIKKDKDGNVISESIYNSNGKRSQFKDYKNKTTTEYSYRDDKIANVVTKNDKGNVIHSFSYDDFGEPNIEKQYNDNGKITDIISHKLGTKRQFAYNQNGKVSKDVIMDLNGQKIQESKYDENGKKNIETKFDKNGKPLSIKSYTYGTERQIAYNQNGKVSKDVVTDFSGHKIREYKYDENGKKTSEIKYNKDGKTEVIKDYQLKRERHYSYNPDGTVAYSVITDDKGNKIKEFKYDNNGKPIQVIKYDANGNVVQ